MEEQIHEAPAPFSQLEEQVSVWQLSLLLDRNPKLHCSSASHLQPLSSAGACQMPACAQRLPAGRHKESWKRKFPMLSISLPTNPRLHSPSSPLGLRQAGLMTAKSSKGPIIWMLLQKAKALIKKKKNSILHPLNFCLTVTSMISCQEV